MVAGSRIEGGPQILSARVRKTIQSIKEIVGNHSDADIYVALKETNMDPNETAQKLLNQDPFHEVKRKRDRRKEGTGYRGLTTSEPKKHNEHASQGMKYDTHTDRSVRRSFGRNGLPGVSREFRVVRDNRTNQNPNGEVKSSPTQCSTSTNEPNVSNVSEKSASGASSNQKPFVRNHFSQSIYGPVDVHPRQAREFKSSGTERKELPEQRVMPVMNDISRMQAVKSNDPTMSLNNSVVGVYSSSTDPVHVPSRDSRGAANVGAIRRDVGVVGVRRQSAENSAKVLSAQSNSFSNSHIGRDSVSRETFRPVASVSKNEQPNQTSIPESAITSVPVNRSFLSNQYNSRSHQLLVGHQKAPQSNKEWKPKSGQKPNHTGPGVIGAPAKSTSPPAASSKDMETEPAQLQDKLSHITISENQNVIIAAHIRVSELDRSRLTFGSLGEDVDPSSKNLGFGAVRVAEETSAERSTSLSVSAQGSSADENSGIKPVELQDDYVRNSGSSSPASSVASDYQLADKKEPSSPQDLSNYSDVGIVENNRPSFPPSESQQQQDPPELPNFSAYDPQTGYDIPYFRPSMDETVRGLTSPQESFNSHTIHGIPSSSMAMVQQQPVAHMYPQVHVSHYANVMPYRQFIPQVYVPPMAMPGYSSNPAYPHPSSGSSYVLMPGGNSHMASGGIKYGIQQFKPVPAGSPTGFGNFTSPTGYAINAPGVVGSGTGLEDSFRLKYKDGNLYVPNPQAETSENWMNPRELPNLQSASYYNMPGQAPHAAYMPSHTGHASFNAAAVAQSSHMQFPGHYHPPQPAAIANPHHLGPTMGGNVGVGVAAAAPSAQVGAYQQPQLGHLNWTGNF